MQKQCQFEEWHIMCRARLGNGIVSGTREGPHHRLRCKRLGVGSQARGTCSVLLGPLISHWPPLLSQHASLGGWHQSCTLDPHSGSSKDG